MNTLQQHETMLRDYSQVSPSAKSLLLLKGITNIPFAKETAALISLPGKYIPDLDNKDAAFWKRVVHFENRYWSIDQLLSQLAISNILELASGYSFRGLETVKQKNVHYIDTDLPEIIMQKKELLKALQGNNTTTKGKLETVPLNALDEKHFTEITKSFAEGPLVIINEGLLMYLNDNEKETLCNIIYNVLKQRGGFWITGDVYVKSTLERLDNSSGDSLKELTDQQRIEDNMFESFDAAKDFFIRVGFAINKEAELDLAKLSSLKYLLNNATQEQLMQLNTLSKIQDTWCLQVSGNQYI